MQSKKNLYGNSITRITRIVLFILAAMLFIPVVHANSVGIIPTTLDLGHVSRAEDVVGSFYLSASSGSELRISADYIPPVSNRWFKSHISEYSEEDISGWLTFPENVMEIDGSKSFPVTIGSTRTRANKKMEFIIHIPKNAEPGYHVGSISLNPVMDKEAGAAVNLFAVSRPNFVFRVNGEVIRRGIIGKIDAARLKKGEAKIILYFINTGTNTISTDPHKSFAKIYNSNNEIRAELPIGGLSIRPGEEIPITLIWRSSEEIKDGRYRVEATINYRSGETSKSGFVTVPSMITAAAISDTKLDLTQEPTDAIFSPSTCSINWTLILALSLLISLVYYWKNHDASILGVILLSIGTFIILSLAYYIIFCYRNIISLIILILIGVAMYYWKKQ